MHIPDGFIAPQMYVPAYGLAGAMWALAARRLRESFDEDSIPKLAVLSAFCFAAMMLMIPLPGGSSAHASGLAVPAIVFGPWTAFVAVSLVLAMQALLFGNGGITTLPVNALALGLAGATVAWASYRALRNVNENAALFAAGWLSVNCPALILAIALGLQPAIASTADGKPLFFPFGLSVTLPAIMIPHALVGIGEGVLTILIYRAIEKRGWTAS